MNKIVVSGKHGRFEEGVIVDNELWYVPITRTALYKMKLSNYQSQEVCKLPYVEDGLNYSYDVVAVHESRLILMPKYADNVLIYNMLDGSFDKVILEASMMTSGTEGGTAIKFRSYAQEGDILWMMPQSCRCIIEYNMSSSLLIEHTNWYGLLEKYHWKNVNLFGKGILVKESLWIPCYQKNTVVEFSVRTKEAKIHYIGNERNCYSAIAYADGAFWILDNLNSRFFKWNPEGGIGEEIRFPEGYGIDDISVSDEVKKYRVACMYTVNEKILLLPTLANQFLLFNTQNATMHNLLTNNGKNSFIGVCALNQDQIICPSQKSEELVIISFEEEKAERTSFYMELDADEMSNGAWIPEQNINLERTIKCPRLGLKVRQKKNSCSIGTNIYKRLVEG